MHTQTHTQTLTHWAAAPWSPFDATAVLPPQEPGLEYEVSLGPLVRVNRFPDGNVEGSI
jgi:hypothetical protein